MTKLLIATFLIGLASLNLHAHEGATGVVKERMDAFKQAKKDMRILKDAVSDGDTATVQRLATRMLNTAEAIPARFPEGSNAAPSEALDEVWLEWDGFMKATQKFESASQRLLDEPGSMDALRDLGNSCKYCHDRYRG